MGSNAAESEVNNAVRLGQARQFILRFLREPAPDLRSQIYGEYSRSEALRFDVIGQLIELLPPPTPAAVLANNGNAGPAELTAVTFHNPKGTPYLLQLPPEYHPHRAYPTLMVLHNIVEDPKQAL